LRQGVPRGWTERRGRRAGFADLLEAELRGIGSHGVLRLSTYLRKLKEGGFNLEPKVRVLRERAGTALLDGDNGMGAVIGEKAMRLCIEKAGQRASPR
jgi:LDH2 family malate/lactate/ureidoglycolate dehydrogenase